jgi:uncharacterized protein
MKAVKPTDAKEMKIFLHELSDESTELSFDQSFNWVRQSVARLDETAQSETQRASSSSAPNSHPIQVELDLRKVDDVVVINGSIDATVQLICSRCATPYSHKMAPRFSSLFCQDPEMAGVGYLNEKSGKPAGINKGYARHAHDGPMPGEDDPIGDSLSPSLARDLDITYISEDFIELGEVITEQLQLTIPFQPLCKESCKGMCFSCGTDLNLGKCACMKLTKESPFSVLKDFQVKDTPNAV